MDFYSKDKSSKTVNVLGFGMNVCLTVEESVAYSWFQIFSNMR